MDVGTGGREAVARSEDGAAVTTRDLSHLLRDAMDNMMGGPIDLVDEEGGAAASEVWVEELDVSDVERPVLRLSNGQAFAITFAAAP